MARDDADPSVQPVSGASSTHEAPFSSDELFLNIPTTDESAADAPSVSVAQQVSRADYFPSPTAESSDIGSSMRVLPLTFQAPRPRRDPTERPQRFQLHSTEGKARLDTIRQALHMPDAWRPFEIQDYLARNLRVLDHLFLRTVPGPHLCYADADNAGDTGVRRSMASIERNEALLRAICEIAWEDRRLVMALISLHSSRLRM